MCMYLHTDVVACLEENDTDFNIVWPSAGASINVTVSCPNAAGMLIYHNNYYV